MVSDALVVETEPPGSEHHENKHLVGRTLVGPVAEPGLIFWDDCKFQAARERLNTIWGQVHFTSKDKREKMLLQVT